MKKGVIITAVAVAAMTLLAGCGSTDKQENGKKDEKIIVYSNSVSEGRGDFLKEKAKEKGFNLEIVDLGGNDLLNRVIAEKDAPIADVVFGMNQMMFSKIDAENILAAYGSCFVGECDIWFVVKDCRIGDDVSIPVKFMCVVFNNVLRCRYLLFYGSQGIFCIC